MKIDLDLVTNRMIIDFLDTKEFDDFINNLEKVGYKIKDYQVYN